MASFNHLSLIPSELFVETSVLASLYKDLMNRPKPLLAGSLAGFRVIQEGDPSGQD